MRRGRSRSIKRCVVDASALVEVLLRSSRGVVLQRKLEGAHLAAPDLINAEVLQALRRLAAAGEISAERGRTMAARLADAPIERLTTTGLALTIWSLRDNLSAYDATYVALTEMTDATSLLTTDVRVANAPGIRCVVQLL